MTLEGIIGKKIEINKKISEYIKANIDLGEEKNEMVIEKLNFISFESLSKICEILNIDIKDAKKKNIN